MFDRKEKNPDKVENEKTAETTETETAAEEIKEEMSCSSSDAPVEQEAPIEASETVSAAESEEPQAAPKEAEMPTPQPQAETETYPQQNAPQNPQPYQGTYPQYGGYSQYPQGGFVYPPQPQQTAQGANNAQQNPQPYPQQGYYGQYPYQAPQPQNMPYAPSQMPPQNMPYPQGSQPYAQNMPYTQNGAPMPPMYPPMSPQQPMKKKMKGGTKFFIFVLFFLFVFGGGVFTYSLISERGNVPVVNQTEEKSEPSGSVYSTPTPAPNKDSENSESSTPNGNDKNGESSESSEGSESPQTVEPDIDVTPYTDGIKITKKPSGSELSAEEVYAKVLPSTVTVYSKVATTTGDYSESYGTGIFITENGYIVTNSHVVNNTKSTIVSITTSDGTEHDCVIVGFDKTTDLAILKIDGKGYTPAEFGDADELSIGEWVIAVGNPGGTEFSGSLTRGVISGLDRTVGSYSSNGMTYIQTDAAINPGNSGGPLVNMYGQVVGINSSKIVADYYEGMGFAIPVSKAKDIIDQLLSTGYVEGRVRLGITGMNYQDFTLQGVEIVSIEENSGFADTDAKEGDVITAIDGNEVTSLTTLANELLSYSPGDTCEVTIVHPANGNEYKVTITLLADEGETQK